MLLDDIVAAKRRAHAARGRVPRPGAVDPPPLRSLAAALSAGEGRLQVIAEYKRRSPSAGALRTAGDLAAVVAGYERAGAGAISVLTDQDFFGGSIDDLTIARATCSLPILRKDFVLFEEDLAEARWAGADAVLLIVRLLDDARLATLMRCAAQAGLETLVEVHDEPECHRALDAGARMIGVNHRDLDRLTIDFSLSERLARILPPDVLRVAESGLRTGSDLETMAARGYHAVLVGESLLRRPSPGEALAALKEAASCG